MALTVFLHGPGTTPQMWQDALDIVAPGTPMAAPWLKGLRPGKDEVFTREQAANEVLGLLNQHGVESMAIVGFSLGATVAVTAATLSPAVVSKLVLIAPPPKISTLVAKAQISALKAAPADSLPGVDRVTTIATLAALAGFDTAKMASKLSIPTLVFADWPDDFNEQARKFLSAD